MNLNGKYETIRLKDSNIIDKRSEVIYEILKCNSAFSAVLTEVRGKIRSLS